MKSKGYGGEDETQDKMSRINSAGLINLTLENLWKDVYTALKKGDYSLLNRCLDSIWLILGGDVKKDDDVQSEFDKMEEKLHETGTLSHKSQGFEEISKGEKQIMAEQYIRLRNKALFLRRLQNSQGKGTAYVNEDQDDFD